MSILHSSFINRFKSLPDANAVPSEINDAESARLQAKESWRLFLDSYLQARAKLKSLGWSEKDLREAGFILTPSISTVTGLFGLRGEEEI